MAINKLLTFPRSDLACEKQASCRNFKYAESREFSSDGFRVSELVTKSGDGEKTEHYVTMDIGQIWLDSDDRMEACTSVLAGQLHNFIDILSGSREREKLCIMVAGLGNRFITSDSLGPLTVDKLTVTRHMVTDGGIFAFPGCSRLCAVQPGVLGQTGLEAASIIRGAVREAKPDILIAVDALAARSLDRLATTIQITDSGIRPGSGIGNRRCAINEESVGCPVIAVGVPTVVDSSTLVYDTLEKAKLDDLPPKLMKVLENGRSFFVSPKDTDIISEELSSLIAGAIGSAAGI